MTPSEVEKLERKIGYQFQNSDYLIQAVTHRSFASHNNERLEFLGDGALNFVIAEALYLHFPDALEAIVAAIYREAGFEATRSVLLKWFVGRLASLSLDQVLKDAKSRLQEYLQGRQEDLPDYEVTKIEGEAHAQTFTVKLSFRLLPEAVIAAGSSKRIAEQNAAQAALIQIGVDPGRE